MIVAYLDASAWVKRYVQEPGTDWIQDFFIRQPVLACASLGFIEVMATLSRKRKAGEIGEAQFDAVVGELERDWQGFVEIRLDADTMALSARVVRELALRGADAVHLASALLLRQRLGDENDEVMFVAADQELKIAAQTSGFLVLDPAQEEGQAAWLTEE